MPHPLHLAVFLRLNRITAILLGLLLAIFGNALAQPTLTIGPNTRVVGTGAVQLVYGGGSLTNTGSLSLAVGQLSATGPTTYGGPGAATVANVSFGHSTGSSTLNSLLSVTNRATLSTNTSLNANGQLYLRTDQFPNADLVNNGILTGTVQGLVTRGTVLTGSTPYTSVLSHNVSGTSARYQWQSSADNSVWTDVPGATAPTYTANVSATTYYRCRLTTSNSNYDQSTPAVLLNYMGSSAQPIRYVTQNGTGDGSSWANASGDLQAMIDASGVQQVWVANGTFKPNTGTDRAASFQMKNGVAIYGGFVGIETERKERPAINPVTGMPSGTTLSGDIGIPGDNSDNSYHVIANLFESSINNTAVLDGFVITGGNASGNTSNSSDSYGGGIYNEQSSPTLINCSLLSNSATDGGGIYNSQSNPTLTNCNVQSNSASKGGGMANSSNSNPSLTNCSLLSNSATNGGGGAIYNAGGSNPRLYNSSLLNNSANKGGAIYANASSAVLINCSLLGNSATLGGGIYSKAGSEISLANCVLWNNGAGNSFFKDETTALDATYSLFDKTVTGYNTDGTGNKTTTTSPFASANTGTPAAVALAANSPAIDAGSNAAYEKGPDTDLAGNPRFFPTGGIIDMGAIESQTAPVPTLTLVVTANPTTILTTGTTTLSATVSGGTSPYSYTFSGPGIISQSPGISGAPQMGTNGGPLPGGNTATVSGLTDGVKTFTVTASDNTTPTSQTISGTVSVTVTQANRPPTAPTFVNQTVTVGTAFSYGVNAFTDPDGDGLNYTVSIDPANGFEFDPYWRTVTGKPITTGVSTVTVTATDPGNLSASATFTITVIPAVLIRYVKTGGTGDGSSWTNASSDLQAMIDAPGVEQVWVASGTFKPTTTTTEPRSASFRMKNGVAIYGGFVGTETSLANRPAVNPVTDTPSSTTLSGDIGIPGDNSDNSYHVFYHFYNSSLNATAVLDGFVIIGGNANISDPNMDGGFNTIGAGMLNLNSSPTLVNCSLQNNSAASNAGGIYNSGSSPTLTNCKLEGNTASSGGGIFNSNGSNPTLTNCSLLNNSAVNNGGGIFNNNGSSPILTNCSLQNNSATLGGGIYSQGVNPRLTNCSLLNNSATLGGALYNSGSNPTLVNCNLQNNSSKEQGGALFNGGSNPTLVNCSLLGNSALEGGGIYNGGSNPTLTNCVLWDNGGSKTISNNSSSVAATYSLFDATVTGYNTDGIGNRTTTTSPFASANPGTPAAVALAANSPAIDAGSNQAYTTANGPDTDLAGNPRFFPKEGTIDMGAVEFQTAPVVSSAFAITGVTTVSCTTLSTGQRQLSFTPQYSGLTGSPVSFSVVNELSPTTAPGPYSLKVYTDNPVITLKAVQSGTAGEASFAYNWLNACNGGSNPPANQAPTTTGIANQSGTVGQAFSLNIASFFTDPNGDALSYQAGGLPTGLSLSGNTISGIPVASNVSSVTVTATDPGSLSVRAIFVLTVNPATGPNPPTAPFSITGVTTVSCTMLSGGQRQLSFTPRYSGLTGEPVSFSVVNELSPTTAPGPYSLKVYTDNPVITLKAVQSGTAGEASFAYNWLAACNAGSRQGIVSDAGLQVLVRGNPLTAETVAVEVRGAQGQPLRLEVLNQLGYPVSTVNQESAADVERVQVRVGAAGGLYFLRVSTPNQQKIIKLLKQ